MELFYLSSVAMVILLRMFYLPSSPLPPSDPAFPRARTNLDYFTQILENEPEKYDVPQSNVTKRSLDPEHERYEQLCRQADPIVRPGDLCSQDYLMMVLEMM